jgi:hypothetical protein
LKSFLQFFKGFLERQAAQNSEAKKNQSTFDLGAIETAIFADFRPIF